VCRSPISPSLLFEWDWKISIVEPTPGIVLSHESFGFVFGSVSAKVAIIDDFRIVEVNLSRFPVGVVLVVVVDHGLESRELAFVRGRARECCRNSKHRRHVKFDRVCVEEEPEGERYEWQQVVTCCLRAYIHEGDVEMQKVIHVVEPKRQGNQRKGDPHKRLK